VGKVGQPVIYEGLTEEIRSGNGGQPVISEWLTREKIRSWEGGSQLFLRD
jgi:hypothetical protein